MSVKRKILLVEDNFYDEELPIMAIQATHLNTEIDVARDGEEALSYLMASESEEKKTLPYLVKTSQNGWIGSIATNTRQ